MRLLYLVESYKEGLGYIDNILPSKLANLGHEVTVVTTHSEPYSSGGNNHFGAGDQGSVTEAMTRTAELEYLSSFTLFGRVVWLCGLYGLFDKNRPNKVMIRAHASPLYFQLVLMKLFFQFEIFGSSGMASSGLNPMLRRHGLNIVKFKNFVTRKTLGRMLSYFSKASVGTGSDCCELLNRYYGVPVHKLVNIPLGVDTKLFHPCRDEKEEQERACLRRELGFSNDDVVCLWSGRMSSNKKLDILFSGIAGLPNYKLLCIGDGPERASVESHTSSVCIDFMPWADLPPYYRAADLAVWPTITTSTLDASATGLPVLMSDAETTRERWEGIGGAYKEGDASSLRALLLSFKCPEKRQRAGKAGISRMRQSYDWVVIAKKYEDLFKGKHLP